VRLVGRADDGLDETGEIPKMAKKNEYEFFRELLVLVHQNEISGVANMVIDDSVRVMHGLAEFLSGLSHRSYALSGDDFRALVAGIHPALKSLSVEAEKELAVIQKTRADMQVLREAALSRTGHTKLAEHNKTRNDRKEAEELFAVERAVREKEPIRIVTGTEKKKGK
jgi:hypothetical protein